jgi:hypothetical protein
MTTMGDKPTLYVCHGDDGGPKVHPCRRAQEALRAAHVDYEKVVAAHGKAIIAWAREQAPTSQSR